MHIHKRMHMHVLMHKRVLMQLRVLMHMRVLVLMYTRPVWIFQQIQQKALIQPVPAWLEWQSVPQRPLQGRRAISPVESFAGYVQSMRSRLSRTAQQLLCYSVSTV